MIEHHKIDADRHPFDYRCGVCHQLGKSTSASVVTPNGFPCCDEHADLVATRGLRATVIDCQRAARKPAHVAATIVAVAP